MSSDEGVTFQQMFDKNLLLLLLMKISVNIHNSMKYMYEFIGIKGLIIFPHYPFNAYRICSDVTSNISDIGNSCIPIFSVWSVWVEVHQLYWY